MKEKMKPHIIAAGALVVFIVLGLACATTLSLSKVEQGKYFSLGDNYKEFINPLIPIEEQCYLINVSNDACISEINDKSTGQYWRNGGLGKIFIVPSGVNSFLINYYSSYVTTSVENPNTAIAQKVETTKTTTGKRNQNRTLEAGNYYFVKWIYGASDPIIVDLKEQSSLEIDVNVDGDLYYSQDIPAKSIIEGINGAIKRTFPNFKPSQ